MDKENISFLYKKGGLIMQVTATTIIAIIIIILLILGGIIWLQIFFSKKNNKSLGLILPVITFIYAIAIVMGMISENPIHSSS
ncbi:MAG: hypothetical protein Q4P13_04035, partial [Psychrobacter sp.]|nr:hypothetical protein [Psychrobacter sp.]